MVSEKIENIALGKLIDRKTLNKIINGTAFEKGIKDIIKDIRADGSVIMTEVAISNGKVGGIIDILAIKPDGTVQIYDFKTKFAQTASLLNPKVKENLTDEFNASVSLLSRFGPKDEPEVLEQLKRRRRSYLQKYSYQLSIYKKLLMEAGIRVGSLNVIGVPYRLNEETKKVSEIKPVVLENINYDADIANYYFTSLDQSFDATVTKKVVLKKVEGVETLETLDKNKLKEAFVKVLARLTEISNKFRYTKDSEELYKLFTNKDAKTNLLDVQKSNIRTALTNFDDVKDFANIQLNFLEMIDSSAGIIKTAIEHFDQLKKKTATDREGNSQKLNEMMKVKEFLMGYKNMFDEILKYMGDIQHTNPLIEKITGLTGVIDKIQGDYVDTITPIINNMLTGLFDEDSLNSIKREFSELIAAAKTRGDEKRAKKLREERDNLPSEKIINEILKGEKGDANWLMSRLMATISNSDIVLAGVAKKLKASLDRVRLTNKAWLENLGIEFDKRSAVYGRGVDIKGINDSLVYLVEEFNPYAEDEEKRTMQVLHFKSEFDEKLYSEHAKILYELVKAEETKDKDVIREIKKKKKEFEERYMQTGYTSAYYEMTKPLDKLVKYQGKEMTIRDVDMDIRNQIRELELKYTEDDKLNGKFNPDYIKELQILNDKRSELREKLDERGNPKTGDALRIAEILEKYDDDKKKLFEFVEQTDYYNRSREKAKLQYGENSDEFQKWISENTRLVIKDEFFKKRQALYDEKAVLENTTQSKEVADLYRELSLLTKPYRDKDGNIKASMISEEKNTKIKELEEKLIKLRTETDINFKNGRTREEQARLNVLYYAKKNKLDYSQREIDEILMAGQDRLAQKMMDDPEFENKIVRLQQINDEIFSLSKTENSKYYAETLKEKEQLFAESLNITYNELLEGKDADGESYYEKFKQSKWYQENHIITSTVYSEDDVTGEKREVYTEKPTYQWRRSMPVEEYIEQKPANHFYKIVDRESYVNDKGETILLKRTDNLDVLNRLKPKTNEEYNKEYGVDHPFLNQEFKDLTLKYKNGTASSKEKVDYENLLFIHSEMLKAQERIPYGQRLGLAVPFKEKHLFERTVESGGKNLVEKGQSIVEGVQRALKRTEQDIDQNGIPVDNTSNDMARLATMDNNEIRHIPVRFSTKGEAANASYDIWGGVLNYVGAINRKSELEKDLAFINGLEEILSDKDNQPKSEDRNMILNKIYQSYIPELSKRINKGGNIRLETFKSFINSVMYNEESFEGYDFFGINTQKALNQLSSVVSWGAMGLAPFNWATNWLSGNIQNIVEASGGRDYTFKDFTAAHADIYGGGKNGSAISDMKDDFLKGKVGALSFWGQIMQIWDPLQGDFENEFGHKTSWNSITNIFKTGIYAGKLWGEWEIQMKTFIAFLKNNKLYNGKVYTKENFITLKLGSNVEDFSLDEINKMRLDALTEWNKLDVNLLDMHEMGKDGKVGIKDEYKDIFQLGSQQFSDTVAKLHAMQKKLNGSYAKFDAAYAQKSSIGKMMFFFRKYFVNLGMNRWGTRRTDYESMTPEQGFYLTFLQTVGQDLVKLKFNIVKNWHNYAPSEKRAIRKTLADIGIVLGIMALYSFVFGYDSDDPDRLRKLREKGWAAQAAVFLLLKVKSETEQFMPLAGIEEIKGIYSNPSLIFQEASNYVTMTKLLGEHMLNVIPGVDFNSSLYYQRKASDASLFGMTLKDEGDSKLFAQLVKTFAGYTGKTFHPDEAIKAWEFNQLQRQK